MGMSASQARFLQLTARQSNVEYQAQRISFERLQLSNSLCQASEEYNNAISNKKLVYTYNTGSEYQSVDVTYKNYFNIMNQQSYDVANAHDKIYLVSSSGNKLVVGSEEDMYQMIKSSQGTQRVFSEKDFMIVDGLEDVDNFQNALQNGIYFFATMDKNPNNEQYEFNSCSWETIMGGAVTEVLDKSDDAQAEAKYQHLQKQIEHTDKKLELNLNELETERSAIQTEIDSVKKVIEDNVEDTFKIFS